MDMVRVRVNSHCAIVGDPLHRPLLSTLGNNAGREPKNDGGRLASKHTMSQPSRPPSHTRALYRSLDPVHNTLVY